jgi:phosphoribosylamine---glycine ligase
MYIFIASLRTWAPTFVYLISKNHNIDFYGCRSNINYSENVNFLGSYFNARNKVIDYLKINWKKFDLIILPDFDWQIDLDFLLLRKDISVPILTPSLEANLIESNKLFSKKLFEYLQIPSPSYEIFHSTESIKKEKFVFKLSTSIIHSGFQTMVFNDDSYKTIIPKYFQMGYTGQAFIEEFIEGKEAVLHFLCNGNDNLYLGSSRDYKKIGENDTGINVSSTGCYSSVEYVNDTIIKTVKDYVSKIQNYIEYVGILCVGIIISKDNNINVLEINVRPGVPEFNTLLLTLDQDTLIENLYSAASRNKFSTIKNLNKSATTIQLFHKNYSWVDKPNSITPDLLKLSDFIVSYFEKEYHHFNYYASISCTAPTKEQAADKIYDHLSSIDLQDYIVRKDIGYLE